MLTGTQSGLLKDIRSKSILDSLIGQGGPSDRSESEIEFLQNGFAKAPLLEIRQAQLAAIL